MLNQQLNHNSLHSRITMLLTLYISQFDRNYFFFFGQHTQLKIETKEEEKKTVLIQENIWMQRIM